jgi:hypothetical protein
MHTTLRIVIMLVASCAALCAAPQVDFDGVRYVLASVEVAKDGAVTNEYVPEGETIDSWTTLLAVRHWPKVKKIAKATDAWMAMVRPLLARDAVAYAADGKKDDLVLEAWLSAPDKSYIEANLHRFVLEDGTAGVKAYQFADKIRMSGGKGDPSHFIEHRDARFAELGKLKLELHREKK